MRSKSDFPALTGIISEINKVVASDSESHSKLAKVILQDFALTNKLLSVMIFIRKHNSQLVACDCFN